MQKFEGERLTAYKDQGGVWTIGYGLTTGAVPGLVVGPGMRISHAQSVEYFYQALKRFGDRILPMMKRKPTDNQFGAMLSLAYNIGIAAFRRSTCLRRFNAGDIEGAATALTWFHKVNGRVSQGLANRRAAERDLFLKDTTVTVTASQPDPERRPYKSRTNLAAIATGASFAASTSQDVKTAISGWGVDPVWLLGSVVVVGVAWVIYDRVSKMKRFGV